MFGFSVFPKLHVPLIFFGFLHELTLADHEHGTSLKWSLNVLILLFIPTKTKANLHCFLKNPNEMKTKHLKTNFISPPLHQAHVMDDY